MEELKVDYATALDNLKNEIQKSEVLQLFLDEEDESLYTELRTKYEPKIEAIHNDVATNDPLQIIAVENQLLDEGFEGLFLPRILGYSVVRGDHNDMIKYVVPQDHFKNILLAICNSSNFDLIKHRIGQSVQIGFALSSDIWITNLLNLISNKSVISFLDAQRLERYRDQRIRHTSYVKFKKQFHNFNYQYAIFPQTDAELKVHANALKAFLLHRSESEQETNSTLLPRISDFLENAKLRKEKEYLEMLMIIAMSFDLDQTNFDLIKERLQEYAKDQTNFTEQYFGTLLELLESGDIRNIAKADERISKLIDRNNKGELAFYYDLMDKIHGYGVIHENSIDAVRSYYDQHLGLSLQNKCLRSVIKSYFEQFLKGLPTANYQDYFEMNKTFAVYMGIFSNEKFNQNIKHNSLAYVKKLLKAFTDKRGKDYQDIKKFVQTTFVDFGFMDIKSLKELFKTKRKKPAAK